MVAVGAPIGSDPFREAHALNKGGHRQMGGGSRSSTVKDAGQVSIASDAAAHQSNGDQSLRPKPAYLEREVDARLSRTVYMYYAKSGTKQAVHALGAFWSCQWRRKGTSSLRIVARRSDCVAAAAPADTVEPFYTGAEGLGLTSTAIRLVSASLGIMCETLPAILIHMSGPLSNSVRSALQTRPLRYGQSKEHLGRR